MQGSDFFQGDDVEGFRGARCVARVHVRSQARCALFLVVLLSLATLFVAATAGVTLAGDTPDEALTTTLR